jgi:ABC-2 type transport system permease protein
VSLLRVELRKLGAQGGIQVLFAVCAFAPMVLAIVLGLQDGLPKDTLFGRYVKDSGFALPLLVLGFAGLWGFPLLAGLVTGQVFAGEDAHGTWQLMLTRSRTRAQVFTGKVLAASLTVLALLATAAVSSLASGLALSGDRALVDLSGGQVGGTHAVRLVLLSWACAAPSLLGFVALSCLLSVLSRSAVVGVGGPVVLGLLMQLLSLLGSLGTATNAFLTAPFSAWHGLVRVDTHLGPLWQGALVCLAWSVACLLPARHLLLHRDVT